jgi:hypothetical protein
MIGARRQCDEWIPEWLRARGVVGNCYGKRDAGAPARPAVQADEATAARHDGAGSNQLGTTVAQLPDERRAYPSIRADETSRPSRRPPATTHCTVTSYVERIIVEALTAKGT